MDWFGVLTVSRVIVAVLILGFASYLDIKTRMASNRFWIILGLIGISLLECQLIVEFGLEAFSYLIMMLLVKSRLKD